MNHFSLSLNNRNLSISYSFVRLMMIFPTKGYKLLKYAMLLKKISIWRLNIKSKSMIKFKKNIKVLI
jgi:hypothetical protein